MAAVYAGQASGGDTSGTGDRTAAVTPAIADLVIALVAVSTNTNAAPVVTDNQGGAYTQLLGSGTWGGGVNTFTAHVRTKPAPAASAHTLTAATGSNDAGVIGMIRISGSCRFGISAIRQVKFVSEGANGGTPAATFDAACLTTNVTIVAVASGDTTTTEPAGWTERIEANQATPTTALEVATRDSGFTGTTVTWGATASTTWAAVVIEIDGTAPTLLGGYPTTAAAMNAACGGGTWSAGWLFNESSGNAAAVFGSPTLTATGATYSTAGMLPSETAIGFDTATDNLNGGNVHDPTTNDLIFAWVGKQGSSAGGSIASKWDGTTGIGWYLRDNFGALTLRVQNFGASMLHEAQISYSFNGEWVVVLGCLDRTAATLRMAMYAPSVGYKNSTITSVAVNTISTTDALILGDDDIGSAQTNVFHDAFYIGAGASVASGGGANALNWLHGLVSYLETPAFPGVEVGRMRPRPFSPSVDVDPRYIALARSRAQASDRPRDLRLRSHVHAPDGYGLGELRSGVGQGYLTDVEARGAFTPTVERIADMTRMRPRIVPPPTTRRTANFGSRNSAALPATASLSATVDYMIGDPGVSPADNSSITWVMTVTVGGVAQTNLVVGLSAVNVNLEGPEIGADYANLVQAVGWIVQYDGISGGIASWTLTRANAAVGSYSITLGENAGHYILVGESPGSSDVGETVTGEIVASSTEYGSTGTSSFNSTIGPGAAIDIVSDEPLGTVAPNDTVSWDVIFDCQNITTHHGCHLSVWAAYSAGATRGAAPTNVNLDGWTQTVAWEQQTVGAVDYWHAAFQRATQNNGTSTPQFSVTAGVSTGTLQFIAEGSSDEVPTTQSGTDDTVTIA